MSLKLKSVSRNLNLGAEDVIAPDSKVHEERIPEEVEIHVPPKKIHNRDLKVLKGFRLLRKSAKHQNLKNSVVSQLKKEVYNDHNYPVDDYKYDRDLVLDCMQLVENIFLESKSGEAKMECVCEVLKPYFVDDAELVKRFIEVQFPKLAQANTVRRVGLKIFDFVLSFF
jgi:hypothetical protein